MQEHEIKEYVIDYLKSKGRTVEKIQMFSFNKKIEGAERTIFEQENQFLFFDLTVQHILDSAVEIELQCTDVDDDDFAVNFTGDGTRQEVYITGLLAKTADLAIVTAEPNIDSAWDFNLFIKGFRITCK